MTFISVLRRVARSIFGQAFVARLSAWNLRQFGQYTVHTMAFYTFFQKIHFVAISIANCRSLGPLDDGVVGQVGHAFTLLVVNLTLACICFFNFFVLWSRRDRVYLRCATVILIDLVSLAVALAICHVFNSLQRNAPHLPIRHKGRSLQILFMTAYDAIVHLFAIVFWIWLLPVKLRFPNRYEPVITKYKFNNPLDLVEGNPLMFQYGDSFPLAQLFQRQERDWKRKRDSLRTEVIQNPPLRNSLIPADNVLTR